MSHVPTTTTGRTEYHAEEKKKPGFFEKLFGADEPPMVDPAKGESHPVIDRGGVGEHREHYKGTTTTGHIETGKIEATAAEHAVRGHETRRVVDERDVTAHRKAEAHVVEEKEIVAPVEHRRVIEERVPHEHVRLIEERQKLSFPKVAQAERRKIIDTKEERKPIETRVIDEKEIRLPVEHVSVIEEVYSEETVQLREEREKVRGVCEPGAVGAKEVPLGEAKVTERPVSTSQEKGFGEKLKEAVGMEKGAGEATTGAEGRRVTGERVEKHPVRRRVVDEGDVTGVVEIVRRIEEIERIEIRRIIEEREPISEPRDLIDFKRKHAVKGEHVKGEHHHKEHHAKEKATLF